MKKRQQHKISKVLKHSIAEEIGIEAGDLLLSINGEEIEDVFDYHYLVNDEYLTVLIEKPNKEQWELEIEKDYEEDLGLEFENSLMDEYRSCRNKCIFCFIDQMPKGMRDTLYFKDDDSRLSFLQGNYVTLTNMSDHDIDRIIAYRLEPINISFHTMNPKLRTQMLQNRFAGDIFEKVKRLAQAGIEMNGQIVLCKGVNDGEELEYSLQHFEQYLPALKSVSVVPVGLTRHRDGLCELQPFNREDALHVLEQIHRWQDHYMHSYGTHLVHASDEWYILAEKPLPEEDSYDGYLQLENGVGMLRLLMTESRERLSQLTGQMQGSGIMSPETGQTCDGGILPDTKQTCSGKKTQDADRAPGAGIKSQEEGRFRPRRCSAATGVLAAPYISGICEEIRAAFPDTACRVYTMYNDFFGEMITVSGLLTGRDLKAQLEGKDLGEELLLPINMLRSDERVFLDDMTVDELSEALGVPIRIVDTPGQALVDAVLGLA